MQSQPQWRPQAIEVASPSAVSIPDSDIGCSEAHADIETGNGDRPLACEVREWVPKITARYPLVALRRQSEGTVGVSGMVSAEGRFVDCAVTHSSGHNVLDQMACVRMMEFARFRPAKDSDGEPIGSPFFTDVVFQLPQWPSPEQVLTRPATPLNAERWLSRIYANYPSTPLRRDLSGSVRLRVLVIPNGRAVMCEVLESTAPSITQTAACLGMERYSRFDPALGSDGEPTNGLYETTITYRLN